MCVWLGLFVRVCVLEVHTHVQGVALISGVSAQVSHGLVSDSSVFREKITPLSVCVCRCLQQVSTCTSRNLGG